LRPVAGSRTVGKLCGLSPPARHLLVAYSTQARKLSRRADRRMAMQFGVRHSLTVLALKKPRRTWDRSPGQTRVPGALRGSAKVRGRIFLAYQVGSAAAVMTPPISRRALL